MSKICNVLFFVLLGAIILGAGALVLSQALGYKPLAILSGSMEPNYHVNGLVIVDTNVAAEDIKTGDVITFDIGAGAVVTHRVVEIDRGQRTFTTKGDANNTADGAVAFDALVGKSVLHIPKAGAVAAGIHTRKGIGTGLIALAALVVLFVAPILLTPEKKDSAGQSDPRYEDIEAGAEARGPSPASASEAQGAVIPFGVGAGAVIPFNIGAGAFGCGRFRRRDASQWAFAAKGDANNTADGAVAFDALAIAFDAMVVAFDAMVEKSVLPIPKAGAVAAGIRTRNTRKGVATGLIALAALAILFVVAILLAPEKKNRATQGNPERMEREAR
jgi:signal peptidase